MKKTTRLRTIARKTILAPALKIFTYRKLNLPDNELWHEPFSTCF